MPKSLVPKPGHGDIGKQLQTTLFQTFDLDSNGRFFRIFMNFHGFYRVSQIFGRVADLQTWSVSAQAVISWWTSSRVYGASVRPKWAAPLGQWQLCNYPDVKPVVIKRGHGTSPTSGGFNFNGTYSMMDFALPRLIIRGCVSFLEWRGESTNSSSQL